MKILEKKNVQINFTESLLRMAADDVEGKCAEEVCCELIILSIIKTVNRLIGLWMAQLLNGSCLANSFQI